MTIMKLIQLSFKYNFSQGGILLPPKFKISSFMLEINTHDKFNQLLFVFMGTFFMICCEDIFITHISL